jgi:ATP-dependent exoDNAse (exonuclease V) beta subunit
MQPEEMRLGYVAVTRAREVLDPAGVRFVVDRYRDHQARPARRSPPPQPSLQRTSNPPDQLVKLRGALALQEDALRDRLDQIREDAAAEGVTLDPVTPQDAQA